MEILADRAFLRPVADGPTLAQVTMVGPKELQISARRGALQFAYAGETEEIAEGAPMASFWILRKLRRLSLSGTQ